MFYGAFVLGGVAGAAFVVAGGVVLLSSALLQPVTTALTAIANSTTKDSFFIGGVTFTGSRKSTSKYLPHFCRNLPRTMDQIQVLHQVAEAKIGQAALFAAQQLAWAAQFQVRFRNFEAIGRGLQNLESCA
jgi:hypothetical protein